MSGKFAVNALHTFILASLICAVSAAAHAQKGTSVLKRLTFAKGASAATARGAVRRGVSHDYLIRARSGQDASFYLEAGAGITFTIIAPNGEYLSDNETGWRGILPASGTYRINVLPDTTIERAKSYILTVRITR